LFTFFYYRKLFHFFVPIFDTSQAVGRMQLPELSMLQTNRGEDMSPFLVRGTNFVPRNLFHHLLDRKI
jgi:hypothetical protein